MLWVFVLQVLLVVNIVKVNSNINIINRSEYYLKFEESYNVFLQNCSQNNIVMQRHDNIGVELPLQRPWTINKNTYYQNPSYDYCSNIEDLLLSLKKGSRYFENKNSTQNSYFKPELCNIRWFSANESCNIMNKFAHVFMIGNSLQRHQSQSLTMLLSNDWEHGSLPGYGPGTEVYEKCHCDGQFSEHLTCRPHSLKYKIPIGKNRICPLGTFKLEYDLMFNDCDGCDHCDKDSRPRFFNFVHGSSLEEHPDTIINIIHSLILQTKHQFRSKRNCKSKNKIPIHFLYSGLTTQARFMDSKYPNQTREKSREFNKIISEAISGFPASYNINVMDFMSLTEDSETSDGYHFLSDVNMLRSMYFLNYLYLLKV